MINNYTQAEIMRIADGVRLTNEKLDRIIEILEKLSEPMILVQEEGDQA